MISSKLILNSTDKLTLESSLIPVYLRLRRKRLALHLLQLQLEDLKPRVVKKEAPILHPLFVMVATEKEKLWLWADEVK